MFDIWVRESRRCPPGSSNRERVGFHIMRRFAAYGGGLVTRASLIVLSLLSWAGSAVEVFPSVDEHAGRDHLCILPAAGKMVGVACDEVVRLGGQGALQEDVVIRIG